MIRYPGLHAVCFVISSITLFGALLWGRAGDIPFLNLMLSFVVVEVLCYYGDGLWSVGIAIFAVVVLLTGLIANWVWRVAYGGAAGPTQ